jgi:drug/metabolite transporter (DMT)-like permease
MDPTGDLAMWNLTIGFLSATFVLPVIQQPHWSSKLRAFVTFIYSIVVGLGTAYFTGAFSHLPDVRAGITSVLLTLIAAISSYKGFALPTGVAPSIEAATSPGTAPATEGE